MHCSIALSTSGKRTLAGIQSPDGDGVPQNDGEAWFDIDDEDTPMDDEVTGDGNEIDMMKEMAGM
jgi:hypothetical protein